MSFEDAPIPRRSFLKFATTALAAGSSLLGGLASARAAEAPHHAPRAKDHIAASTGAIRVGSVSTAVEGGVLPTLIPIFQKETGLEVKLIKDDEPFDPAKEGKYDLVISHFGHHDVQDFILKGYGEWPRTVFCNQLCLAGPPSDPAKVAGLTLVEAFGRIAAAKAPYVVNETKGISYLTEMLWIAAGRPERGSWLIRSATSKKAAVEVAAEEHAYVFWGLTPFLREKKAHGDLVPLITADPLLQRMMVAIVLKPERVHGINAAGAARFQKFLLEPATQAAIMKVHYPGAEQAVWMPAGRHNAGPLLPIGGPGSGGGNGRGGADT